MVRVDERRLLRLIAHTYSAAPGRSGRVFKIFTCQDGYLLGIGRNAKLVAAHRALEERIADVDSVIELTFVDEAIPSERFLIRDIINAD